MDRNVLNDIVNILCANIEKVHGVIITNGGVITNAYGMNKYEYLDRIVFSNEYMNNIILEYKDIKTKAERIQLLLQQVIQTVKEKTDLLYPFQDS